MIFDRPTNNLPDVRYRCWWRSHVVALAGMLLSLCLGQDVALAGLLIQIGPNWNNFVFEPLDVEDTPNYYGYGGRANLGYSFANVFDLSIYGHYAPGRLDSASFTDKSALLIHGGGEAGVRFGQAVYLGVRGGPAQYKLYEATLDSEIKQAHAGSMVQGSMGLILPVTKSSMWQATFDLGQGTMVNAEDSSAKTRTMTHVSVTISFVYNDKQMSAVDTAIFNNWINNIGF